MYLLSDHENQIQDEKGRNIVRWLSHLNFWSKQDDTFERRQEGTGNWLLNDSTFQGWVNGKFNVLWCPGDRKTALHAYNAYISWCRKDCVRVSHILEFD